MGRTILLADDSAAIQKKAIGILAGEGLEVLTVSNGVAAIKKLSSLKPLLVLADVSMPGKDGYEVCEFVKTNPDLAYIPVLLLVSDLEPYDEHRGAVVRANGMLQKPFDPGTLISMVTKHVAQAEAAVAEAQVAETVINAAPPPPEFTVPTLLAEEELEAVPKSDGLDWGALPEGSAFAEPMLYQTHVTPTGPELEAAAAGPQSETAPEMTGAPELSYGELVPMEYAPESAVETEPEAEPAVPEAGYAEPAPMEYAPVAPVEAEPEAVPVVPEAGYAEAAPVGPTEEVAPAPSEPMVFEEAAPVVSEPASTVGSEATMMYRAPIEIAEPVPRDELPPAPPVEEPQAAVELEVPAVAAEPEVVQAQVAEPELSPAVEDLAAAFEVAPAAEVEAVPAAEETVASPVESAPPAEEAVAELAEAPPPAAEAQSVEEVPLEVAEASLLAARVRPCEEAAPEVAEAQPPVAEAQPAEVVSAPTARTPLLDPDWVYWIVRTVVVKMSPPVFSAEAIEDVARKITDEINAELDSYTPLS